MTDRQGRIFDELARFMTDAAGAAQGMRREVETMVRSQAERFFQEMDLVTREQFEVVEEMARKAREENAALRAELDALKAQMDTTTRKSTPKKPAKPASPK